MAWQPPGGYGSSPYPDNPPFWSPTPENSQTQAPPQNWNESTGEFNVTLNQPQWVEAGNSPRFSAYFVHMVDGVCASMTSGPTIAIKDGNGNAVPTSGVNGIILGTVTAGTSPGIWFSVLQIGASVPPGKYEAQWTATYTPVNTQEPQVALPIQVRREFIVKVTKSSSQFFFKSVSQF